MQHSTVEHSLHKLERAVIGLSLCVALIVLLGAAAAVQIINGDLTVTGTVKCASVTTDKSEVTELDVKKNIVVAGTVNGIDLKTLKETVDGLSTKSDSMKKTLDSVAGRNVVETRIIRMGEFSGNNELEWVHNFEADVEAVTGFVQDTDGAYVPLIGSCKAMTYGLSTQRIDGKLRLRVSFNPRYNKLPFAFVCLVVKKGG